MRKNLRSNGLGVMAFMMLFLAIAPGAHALNPTIDPVPLWPETPFPTETTITSNDIAGLRTALALLNGTQSNYLITLEPGVYTLLAADTFIIDNVANIQIRQKTQTAGVAPAPALCVVNGAAATGNVFDIQNAQNITFAHFSITGGTLSAVLIDGNAFSAQGGYRFWNMAIANSTKPEVDIRDVTVVTGATPLSGVTGFTMEYCIIGPTAGSDGEAWLVSGENLKAPVFRHNLFMNANAASPAPPAIPLVDGGIRLAPSNKDATKRTDNAIVEMNTFLQCERSIFFDTANGGTVRHNMIVHTAALATDSPITVKDTPGVQVLHNTILSTTTVTDIEITGAASIGGTVQQNLVTVGTAGIGIKNLAGAGYGILNNFSPAVAGMFINSAAGNLHLIPPGGAADVVINKVTVIPNATADFDTGFRPSGPGEADYGADEEGVGAGAGAGGGGGGRVNERLPIRPRPFPGQDTGRVPGKGPLLDRSSYRTAYNTEVARRQSTNYNQREQFRQRGQSTAINSLYQSMMGAAKAQGTGSGSSRPGAKLPRQTRSTPANNRGGAGVGMGN